MTHKSIYLLILSISIIIAIPSIGFCELKTVQGEYCLTVSTSYNRDIDWNHRRKYVRKYSIENGLKKIIDIDPIFNPGFTNDIQQNYLNKFQVLSHTEKGSEICEKVQFTIDTVMLQKVMNSKKMTPDEFQKYQLCIRRGYQGVNLFLELYIWKENRPMGIGVIVENQTRNNSQIENDRIRDNIEETLIQCRYERFTEDLVDTKITNNRLKLIERRYLNKILEEHKLSVSGITEGNSVLSKIKDLDIILLRIIYDDKTTTKLLDVETGRILYVSTDDTK
jgi:hypothetical protein